jgi:hypothetical protein
VVLVHSQMLAEEVCHCEMDRQKVCVLLALVVEEVA